MIKRLTPQIKQLLEVKVVGIRGDSLQAGDTRPCKKCKTTFVKKHGNQTFCNDRCSKTIRNKKYWRKTRETAVHMYSKEKKRSNFFCGRTADIGIKTSKKWEDVNCGNCLARKVRDKI